MMKLAKVMGGLLAVGLAVPAAADEPAVTLKVVGQPIQNILHTKGEVPFFGEILPELSGNTVKVDLVSADQLGVSGPEVIRMLSSGAISFASGGLTQAVRDEPKFEGCDLPGLTGSLDEARAACAAYRPVLDATLRDKFGIKLLALGANPPQAIWCSDPVSGLADLKGRKIRVYNQALTDFVAGAGATAVNIPYGDTVPALQNGVIDCAITGTLTGNTSKWFEVTSHLYPMSLGWAIQYWGANLEAWNALTPEQQAVVEEGYGKLEETLWALAAEATAEGINCNRGDGTCDLGVKGAMTIVEPSAADLKQRAQIMESSVLPAFASRCGSDCAAEWNDTVGKAVGFTLKAD
ncbi:TRAP transporter substrate-binding protein [Methylobrevis pamukkalensis]|uniref:Bacterial extracellular solute-binding protein, family 7 n=1 Tax=Methylobrevis pamukkalensis TaxID=1439726 RepID=A0A1E3GYG4_9HYPH|nr:TRAP transporter substrate-binding protein [Methylobrevis pamukkalensis]ODN69082.1 Bacterial extracellular solute-binding protein, family 7 [Methylobrevis pamukkalensis]